MKRAVRGFTLLETLIALVLLSLGLLGAYLMLLGSLQAHANAMNAVSAVALTRDMADRIRANPRAAAAYDTRHATPLAADCDHASPCAPRELAAADLAHFVGTARALLPGSETVASVEFEPAIGPAATARYAITLRWRGPRDDQPLVVAMNLLAPPVAG
jgi:type IV pilus assembly protein PilV